MTKRYELCGWKKGKLEIFYIYAANPKAAVFTAKECTYYENPQVLAEVVIPDYEEKTPYAASVVAGIASAIFLTLPLWFSIIFG